MRRATHSDEVLAKLALAALIAGAFAICLTASTDGDVFWHLAGGREMLKRGALLRFDEFSLSAQGRPWIDVHWLFQLICAIGYQLGGLRALVLGKALLVASGALVLAAFVRRWVGTAALPLCVLGLLGALLAVRDLLLLRPTMFTLLFIALFIHTIELSRLEGRPRRLWLLPLVQIAWVNIQGLFALGPAIIVAYWVGLTLEARFGRSRFFPFARDSLRSSEDGLREGLLWALAGSAIACLANPFGLRAVGLPSELLRRLIPGHGNAFSKEVAENVPPFVLYAQTGQFWHLKWFLLALALSVVVAGRRLRLHHCLLVGGFLLLALIANRNVLLFYWVATPIGVGYLFTGALRLLPRRRELHVALRAATGAGVIALSLLAVRTAQSEPSIDAPAPFRVPELSAGWIAQHGGKSRIFAADHYGGYLIWKLFPNHAPYIDTRLILRTEQEFGEYLSVVDHPERFDAFAERVHFDYVVLPTAYPERYLALLRHLHESTGWRLVLSDGSETLFARRGLENIAEMNLGDAGTTAALLDAFARRYPEARVRADARLQLATLELALGYPEQVEQALRGSDDVHALALCARARLAQADSAGAGRIALRALQTDPDHVRSLNLLAVISLERGEIGKAMGYLRHAARANPFDPETLTLLHSLEVKPHDAIN